MAEGQKSGGGGGGAGSGGGGGGGKTEGGDAGWPSKVPHQPSGPDRINNPPSKPKKG